MLAQAQIKASPLKVLVVDDEESIRYTLDKMLSHAGYAVAPARDCGEARELIGRQDFDIAIIDRMLPNGENGLDIIKHLKVKKPLCEVIFISGYPTFDSACESMRYETFAYITKPFTPDKIQQVVGEAAQKVKRRKAAEERFIAAGALSELGLLSAQVAHEINNPLQVITGHAEIMMEDVRVSPEVKKTIAVIQEAASSIKKLNRDLRELSRPQKTSFVSLKPEAPLETALDFMAKTGATKYCKSSKDYAADTPFIRGDAFQLRQVFVNLILNSLQAMKNTKNKSLSVKTLYEHKTDSVLISVRDTGCGMAKDVMDKIFENFYTTRAAEEGTGLGLALVKKIISNHGGAINVESEPGEGATFTVALPAVKE